MDKIPMVTQGFYDEVFWGDKIKDEDTFTRLEAKAERQINKYCNNYFDNHTLDDLELESDRTDVKLSICAQIEYFNALSCTNELAGNGQVTSVRIGETTKSFSNVSLGRSNVLDSQQALEYLESTGLLYRGVGEYDG